MNNESIFNKSILMRKGVRRIDPVDRLNVCITGTGLTDAVIALRNTDEFFGVNPNLLVNLAFMEFCLNRNVEYIPHFRNNIDRQRFLSRYSHHPFFKGLSSKLVYDTEFGCIEVYKSLNTSA